MVGDYISTSFVTGGHATTAFAVGVPHVLGTPFNEAMYAPTAPLTVATRAEAVNASSTAGVVGPVTGVGTGETHQAIRND